MASERYTERKLVYERGPIATVFEERRCTEGCRYYSPAVCWCRLHLKPAPGGCGGTSVTVGFCAGSPDLLDAGRSRKKSHHE